MQAPAVNNRFEIGRALGEGWSVTWSNILLLMGISIVVWAIYLLPSLVFATIFVAAVKRIPSLFGVIVLHGTWHVLHLLLCSFIQAGLIKVALDFVRHRKGVFADLFSCWPIVINYFLGWMLYGGVVLGGLILFIIPGIMWGIQFQFFNFAIVDEGCGPLEALQRSSQLTSGNKWSLFGYDLICLIINFLGFLCLVIGLFFTFMITSLATASVFLQLKGPPPAAPEESPVPA